MPTRESQLRQGYQMVLNALERRKIVDSFAKELESTKNPIKKWWLGIKYGVMYARYK